MPLAFSDFVVKIDGQPTPDEFDRDLIEIVVETDLRQPSMFVIRLHDTLGQNGSLEWADSSRIKLGAAIEISAVQAGAEGNQPRPEPLFKGEVTGLEPEFEEDGRAVMVIRGYDKSHRLQRGRKTRTFLKQKDSDIVSTLASEAGLTAVADATTTRHDYLIQRNQSNMEFLLERARRLGYQVYSDNGKLYFKKPDATQGDGPALKWGEDLRSFRPRLSAAHQFKKVTVRGWDPVKKEAVSGTETAAAPAHQAGVTQSGGAASGSAFGEAEEVIVDGSVADASEAKAIAAGRAAAISADFLQAEGICFGNPGIQAGKVVTVSNVGRKFSGKYFVTSASHRLEPGSGRGYETTFLITGHDPFTIGQLAGAAPDARPSGIAGVVVGVVTNVKDEAADMGRVKVKFPWLGADVESHWARLASPMAGAERGLYCLPEVNDEVLVAFEHGDINRPYVLGVLWNGKDKPPVAKGEAVGGDGKVNQRAFKSRSGHLILLDDKQGAEKITLKDKTGNHELTIDSTAKTLTIKMASNEFVLDATGNKLAVKTGNGGLTLETQGAVSIKSSTGEVKLEGMNITLQATTGLTLKNNAGAQIALNGPAVNVNNGALEVM
jgi:Rhs element Vgr protein